MSTVDSRVRHDAQKHAATVAMAAARDKAMSRCAGVAEGAYFKAHTAMMAAETPMEVERVLRSFENGMLMLMGALGATRW